MFIIAVMGAIAALTVERRAIKALGPKAAKLHAENPGFNLAFSLTISILLGIMFPAAGLIIFMIAIMSTMFSVPYAKFMVQVEENWPKCKAWWATNKDRARELAVALVHTIAFIIRVITFPYRAYVKVRDGYQHSKAFIQTHLPSKA